MTQTTEEQAQVKDSKKLFAGLGILGVIAVLLGVWVLLLDNWFDTANWLKIVFGGGVLCGALFGAARVSKLPERWPRDLFLLFHSGALLMMTWIIATIYNVHSHPWRAMALCALLSLPGALSGELSILGDVVIVFALTALFAFIGDHPGLHPLVQGYSFFFFIGILALWLFRWSRQFAQSNGGMRIALQRWGWILSFIALSITLHGFSQHAPSMSRSDFWLMLAYLGGVYFWGEGAFGPMEEGRGRLFWFGALLLPLSAIAPSLPGGFLLMLAGFALTIWFLTMLINYCVEHQNPNGAKWALTFLVLRVFIFYGELLDGALSGWWLILIGFSLGVAAYNWSHLRPILMSRHDDASDETPSSAPGDQGFLFASLGVLEMGIFLLWIIVLELR